MRKTKGQIKITKRKNESESLAKIKEEISKVKNEISKIFKSAETISVDTEFKEVMFYVCQDEFEIMGKNISNENIDLTFLKADKDTISFYFRYELKK